jgi:hypothetical protein
MKQLFERTPGLKRLASGPVTYSASLLGRTVPRFLIAPMPEFRVINAGRPAIRMGQDGRPVGREIPEGETIYEGPAYILAFSTIPYWGFGARIFPFADERDDRFSLRVCDITSVQVAAHIRSIWRGSYRADSVHDFLCERISIHYDDPMPLQIGGDVVGRRTVVTARLAEPVEVVDYYAPPPISSD